MNPKDWARNIWALCFTTSVGLLNFIVFGLIHHSGWKDAADYSAYAKNMLLGLGYTMDGVHVSIYREPGAAFYLMPFYAVLGSETPLALFAASFTQGLLLGFIGFFFYRILRRHASERLALFGGATISIIPILGYYANEIGAEAVFTFFLCAIFIICVHIMREYRTCPWYWYALLGILCGIETLIRFQFVLFVPFIALCFALYVWPISRESFRNITIAFVAFILLPLSFATYSYLHTGLFAVTDGRQNDMIYQRAVRADLSYTDITRYMRDWLWRSVSGGVNTQFLTDHDFKKLGYEYSLIATSSEAIARIRAENIRTILSRPGHYLYGNIVEIVKLGYIDHDYSDTMNRYFRPAVYALMYSFFLFGLYQLVRTKNNWDLKSVAILALIFIFYNTALLSFLNTVPRLNTPYLPLFILVGFVGLALLQRKREKR